MIKSQQTFRFTFSLFAILILCGRIQAQDTTEVKSSNRFVPYEIKLGVNAVRSIRTFAGSGFTSHEVEAMLSFDKFVFAIDYGIQETHRSADYQYFNEGSFYRVGLSKSFVKNKVGGNTISLGLRYANANFEDRLSYTIPAEQEVGEGTVPNPFGEQNIELSNSDLRATWFELVFDMRGKISGNLFIGLTTRWQFGRSIKGEGLLEPYDIPGFGTTKRTNSTAFDYYIMWRIPFSN